MGLRTRKVKTLPSDNIMFDGVPKFKSRRMRRALRLMRKYKVIKIVATGEVGLYRMVLDPSINSKVYEQRI
jgi:hypothetical protein